MSSIKLYYTQPYEEPNDLTNKLIPAPLLTIEPELLYVNDMVVGYIYNINIEGYATALNLDTYTGGELTFTDTMQAVQKVRDIFSFNGGTLIVKDSGGEIIRASGGLLQSLQFDETDNNWFNYARYTASLSFSTLDLGDCENIPSGILCSTLPSGIVDINNPYIADMTKYKVKSVSDTWTIEANEIYNSNSNIDINNEYLDISYEVQAVGQHAIVNGVMSDAWKHAKNYCINARLIPEINRLYSRTALPLLSSSENSTCTTSVTASDFSTPGYPALLHSLSSGNYNIYNETIQSDISESDGSFSLTFKCILKKTASSNSLFSNTHCIHRITQNRSVSDDGNDRTVTESIQGEIEGLVQGGLLSTFDTFEIPDTGFLINPGLNPVESKYKNALDAYNKISEHAGSTLGRQLKSTFVTDLLGVTNSDLDPFAPNPNNKPRKISHVVNHNYLAGTISYTEEYNNKNMVQNSGVEIRGVNINIDAPKDEIAEFIVPGRASGPIIQKFIAQTPRRITVSIDGRVNRDCCDILELDNICTTGVLSLPNGVPGTGLNSFEITENRYTLNSEDGSFTINRAYIYIG